MTRLVTERLDLVSLTPLQLQQYLNEAAQLEEGLGFRISRAVITPRVQRAIHMKLAKMAPVEPARYEWYTYWLIVVRAIPFGAGLVGFKGFPDENGEAEIGYGIDPDYGRQGYTTEAVRRLIAWTFEEPACLSVVARDTKKWNVASLRVLEKVGMRVFEESEDAFWLRVERST